MATRNNRLIIAVKALTFIPLGAVIYFTQFPMWVRYYFFVDSSDHVAGFIVASFALFALGVTLKRRIISTYLQTSKNDIILGSAALAFAAALYILGTVYFLSSPVLPYESLIVFAVAYILLRSDTRLIILLWPLFALMGVAPLASVLDSAMGSLISGFIVVLGMFGLFDVYLVRSIDDTNENLRLLGLPAFVLLLGLGYWFFAPSAPPLLALVFLIPASLLLLAAPRIGPKLQFSQGVLPGECPGHREFGGSGFCEVCGRKFASMKSLTPSGLAGLVIAIIVLGILLTTQIPLLTLNVSGANTAVYSYAGVVNHALPQTPAGWLVNSSAVLVHSSNLYALKQVYVPAYHPEVRNYTLYFGLSSPGQNLTTIALGALPGFSRSAVNMQLGGYSGYLITFVSSKGLLMIAFAGKTTLRFLSGSNFYVLTESVAYIRNFTGVGNSTEAGSEVVS
ncbi:MAG: hypothetical protein ACRDF4_06495, partial [Rhabdochlamydiaceae bacterium]